MKNRKIIFNGAVSVFFLLATLFSNTLIAQDKANLDGYVRSDKFNYSEPILSDLEEPIVLWATNYHIPEVEDGSGEIALRNILGEELGPKVTLREWCKSALEGSVRIIFKDKTAKTYNYDSSNELYQNDCSSMYTFNLGKTKFRIANGKYGDGIANYKLTPYRTIATDITIVPTGTVLYIPEAKGAQITLENGEMIIHDGYFFAGDIGGAIKLNHIDVFIGTHTDSPFFKWIGNNSTSTFKAYIVKDQNIIKDLISLHQRDL